MSDAPPLCVFHKNCIDGRSAAAVVARREARITPLPWLYGMQRPVAPLGGRVYVVDVALPADDMRALAREAAEVTWIDHHETGLRIREELGWGIVDTSECGATLCWRVLFGDEPMPAILPYVRDKDLWLWELPDSRAVNAGLAERFGDDDFAGILDAEPAEMAAIGRPVLERMRQRVQQICSRGVPVDEPYGLRGVRALVINDLNQVSEVGEHVYLPVEQGGLGYDLAICFAMRRDGRWVHSLRSLRVDCERIAANRGGGGHRNAASYIADTPFPQSEDCLDWPA